MMLAQNLFTIDLILMLKQSERQVIFICELNQIA